MPPRTDLPADLALELRELHTHVRLSKIVPRLWRDALTPEERTAAEDDPAAERDLTTWLAERRGISPERSLLQLAVIAEFILAQRADVLLRRLGESHLTTLANDRPHFDAGTGILTCRGREAGRFRVMRHLSCPMLVLMQFEDQGWPPTINSPFPEKHDLADMHTIVRRINDRCRGLRFRVLGAGRNLAWEIAEPTANA